jgi:polar amino acid transport system substrate-binding protein
MRVTAEKRGPGSTRGSFGGAACSAMTATRTSPQNRRQHRGSLSIMPLRRTARLLYVLILSVFFCLTAAAWAADPHPPDNPAAVSRLRGGWYPSDPYQYREYRNGIPVLTGFDVAVERAVAREMGVELVLDELAWADHLSGLAAGTFDIAAGATESPERATYAYFSKPYRRETDVLILRRGEAARYPFETVEQMLAAFSRDKFRLGVIAGYVYADERVNRFIGDPANRDRIVVAGTDAQNLRNLLDGGIDGFLADRIGAATTAWRLGEGGLIEEHPLQFATDIHFMLSRASQTAATLARLNAAIDHLQQSGELRRIADSYALPVLIGQTLDRGWFQILIVLGTVAFAVSGVVLASAGQYTLFGAVILAGLPTVGGGVVRDLLLQREPLGVVRDPTSLLAALATVLCGMIVIKAWSFAGLEKLSDSLRPRRQVGTYLIETCDALGLGAFIVVGVVVVLDAQAQPLWLWGTISAVITGSFGGLMRDLFRQDRQMASLRGEFYPEIAVIWGFAFSVFLHWESGRLQPEEIRLGVIVTILGAFLSRMAAIAGRVRGVSYV